MTIVHTDKGISVLYQYQADLFKKLIPPCGRGLSSSSWCEVEIVPLCRCATEHIGRTPAGDEASGAGRQRRGAP